VVRYRYPAGHLAELQGFPARRLDQQLLPAQPAAGRKAARCQQVKDMISPDFVMNEQTVRVRPITVRAKQLQFYYDWRR